MKPNIQEISQLLYYENITGKLFWKRRCASLFPSSEDAKRFNAKLEGVEAGNIVTQPSGLKYIRIRVNGKPCRAHHLVWLFEKGVWPKDDIDHIDGNGLNNRISNLRVAGKKINNRNRRKQKNNSSGVTGVTWNKKDSRWMARMKKDGLLIHLGSFKTLEEAKAERERALKGLGYSERHGK